jgi:MFS family permease
VCSSDLIQLVIRTILDYPSGALGDFIGQRFVIATALTCYAIGFWLTSIVDVGTPYPYFVAIYVVMGIGQSQESGAWGAWFDNNYRVAMPHDKDRKMYGVMQGRSGMLFQIVATLVLLPGAWLAVFYTERWVFRFQAIMSVFLALVVLKVIKDFPEAEALRKKQNAAPGGYSRVLKDGLKFVGSSRFVSFVILGETILFATGVVWWEIILFPLYFVYLLSYVGISGFRTLVFIPNVAAAERSGIWSRRFDPVKWIPRFRLLQFCGFVFYLLLSMTTFIFMPPALEEAHMITIFIPLTSIALFEVPAESVIPLTLIFIIFIIGDFLGAFADVLTQRVLIDVIPNRIRNSLYSLRPALTILCAIPLIWFFSQFLPLYGFGPSFALISIVALAGAALIRVGFS